MNIYLYICIYIFIRLARRHPTLSDASTPAQRSLRRGGRLAGIHPVYKETIYAPWICVTLEVVRACRLSYENKTARKLSIYASIHLYPYIYVHASLSLSLSLLLPPALPFSLPLSRAHPPTRSLACSLSLVCSLYIYIYIYIYIYTYIYIYIYISRVTWFGINPLSTKQRLGSIRATSLMTGSLPSARVNHDG